MRRLISFGVNHQLECRMQEICQSGSEGGAKPTLSLPLFQPPGVLTPGTHPTRRVAQKGRKVKFIITSEYGLVRHTT
jgi:hypothetical protein